MGNCLSNSVIPRFCGAVIPSDCRLAPPRGKSHQHGGSDENMFARHENMFARHENMFARHENMFARHENMFARHENM
ncbi:MAG: hypothetical protein LBJ41_11595, partial [Treponema sp.]|nr:hypothetical protein [Treponema sp.]